MAAGLLASALAQVPACAADVVHTEGRWRQRTLHASVADPDPAAGPWQRREVAGTALSFAGPAGASLSWIRHCGAGSPEPRIALRLLVMGVVFDPAPEQGPVEVAWASGWRLAGHTRLAGPAGKEGQSVYLEAVTRVGGGCTDDFLWVQPGSAPAPAAAFRAFWASFRDEAAHE